MALTKSEKEWIKAIVHDKVNHFESSPETRRAIDSLKENIIRLDGCMEKVEQQMQNRITYKQFYWIIGIILMLTIGVISGGFALLNSKIENISEKQYITNAELSKISGVLEQYDFVNLK
jgi:hypothetical protein